MFAICHGLIDFVLNDKDIDGSHFFFALAQNRYNIVG